MLRKKTNGVARRPQRTSILSDVAGKSVDRRAFLRGSGLAIGGLGRHRRHRRHGHPASHGTNRRERPRSRPSNRSAPIVRSAAR